MQVNVTAAGGQPPADSVSEAASISADGRYVEFESDASNLVPGGPAKGFYVKDMQTGAVELASRATGPDGAALPPSRSRRDLGRRASRRVHGDRRAACGQR